LQLIDIGYFPGAVGHGIGHVLPDQMRVLAIGDLPETIEVPAGNTREGPRVLQISCCFAGDAHYIRIAATPMGLAGGRGIPEISDTGPLVFTKKTTHSS